MSAFEDYVEQELPRRPVLLTASRCGGYTGSPNGVGAPVIVSRSPPGTLYLQESDGSLWYKKAAIGGTWVNITTGVVPLFAERYQVDLLGLKNGSNRTFTTPEPFVENTERIYRNGVRLMRGVSSDYITQESGGPGSGFDTIVFNVQPGVEIAPIADELLFADYTSVN